MFYIFARDPRGCDVALWATWQRHRGPRGAYPALHIFLIIYIVYKWVFSLPYIGRVFDHYKPSGLINLTISVVLLRVGLIHTIFLRCG